MGRRAGRLLDVCDPLNLTNRCPPENRARRRLTRGKKKPTYRLLPAEVPLSSYQAAVAETVEASKTADPVRRQPRGRGGPDAQRRAAAAKAAAAARLAGGPDPAPVPARASLPASMTTTSVHDFRAWPVSKLPPCKPVEVYVPSVSRFEHRTTSQADFVEYANVGDASPKQRSRAFRPPPAAPFSAASSNKLDYPGWQPTPQPNCAPPGERKYYANPNKFSGEATSKRDYPGFAAEPVRLSHGPARGDTMGIGQFSGKSSYVLDYRGEVGEPVYRHHG